MYNCSNCKSNVCYQGKDCAKGYDFSDAATKARNIYEQEEDNKILTVAGRIEVEHYMKYTRLEEIMEFCRLMEYRKIGIASCVGLSAEADILTKILSKEFEVHSVCCKSGGINKDDYGIPHLKKERYEATCNPAGQAEALNSIGTDINLIVGLCVGHDILFSKYSKAPCTTFIVKDRVLAHNPAAAIYSNYYKRKLL